MAEEKKLNKYFFVVKSTILKGIYLIWTFFEPNIEMSVLIRTLNQKVQTLNLMKLTRSIANKGVY